GERADVCLILDNQDSFVPAHIRRQGGKNRGLGDAIGTRKLDLKSGPLTRPAANVDFAAALADDAVDRGKAKASSLPCAFRSEERIEDATLSGLVHALAGVRHSYGDEW